LPQKLRFCILGPAHPLRGGIAQYLAILYSLLKQDHEVSFVSFKRQYPSFLFPGKTQLDPGPARIDVRPRALIDSINPVSWFRTFSHVRRFRPHVLVFKWWTPFFGPCYATISFLARRFVGARVLFICDNVVPHERRMVDNLLTRIAFSQVDYFVTLSHSVMEDLMRIRAAANAVEIAHPSYVYFTFSRVEPREAKTRLELDGRTILFFGYVRPYKGVHNLLDAFAKVSSRLNATLVVVGEFYEPSRPYVEHIERLRLGEKVRLVDRYVSDEEVGLYFSAADVAVLPYSSATQSGVVQVAFAFDTPVISTAVGGIPEVVKDGVNGLLVPPDDPDALAAAMVKYFEEGLAEKFAANIRAGSESFSWKPLVETLERFGSEVERSWTR
jgi:glycosyltransferase involved in cell wall biosynthesis